MKPLFPLFAFLFFSSMLFGQNAELNSVAKKHYTNEQIQELKPVDIEKINYYYAETFVIDTKNTLYSKFVSQYCKEGIFDITDFEKYRGYYSYVNYQNEEFQGFIVILTPWIIIEKKYKEIEAKYN